MTKPSFVRKYSASGAESAGSITIANVDPSGGNAMTIDFGSAFSTGNVGAASASFNGSTSGVTSVDITADSPSNRAKVWSWIKLSPSGTHDVVVSWPSGQSADRCVVIVSIWNDVDQTTPTGTVSKGSAEASTTTLGSVASTTNDLVHDAVFAAGNTITNLAPGTGQTEIDDLQAATVVHGRMAASYKDGAATSTSMSWTLNNGTDDYGHLAYALKGAAGGTVASGNGASLSQSTATGAGAALAAGSGRSLGGSAAYAQGIAIASGTGASLSQSTARTSQSVIASGSGASLSQSFASAPPATIATANAFSLGLSFATGTASSATIALGSGAALCLSHAYAVGSAIAAGTGAALSLSRAVASPTAIARGDGLSLGLSLVRGAGGALASGVGFSLSLSVARGIRVEDMESITLLDEPLSIDFDSLETALDFDPLDTAFVFLTLGGDTMFTLKILEGEVTAVTGTLEGRDPITKALVPHDLTGASSIKLTVRVPDKPPIINARDMAPVSPPTSGRVTFTPTPTDTAVGGKYKALVVVTYPGSPNPIVRKFPGEVWIEDAIA